MSHHPQRSSGSEPPGGPSVREGPAGVPPIHPAGLGVRPRLLGLTDSRRNPRPTSPDVAGEPSTIPGGSKSTAVVYHRVTETATGSRARAIPAETGTPRLPGWRTGGTSSTPRPARAFRLISASTEDAEDFDAPLGGLINTTKNFLSERSGRRTRGSRVGRARLSPGAVRDVEGSLRRRSVSNPRRPVGPPPMKIKQPRGHVPPRPL